MPLGRRTGRTSQPPKGGGPLKPSGLGVGPERGWASDTHAGVSGVACTSTTEEACTILGCAVVAIRAVSGPMANRVYSQGVNVDLKRVVSGRVGTP